MNRSTVLEGARALRLAAAGLLLAMLLGPSAALAATEGLPEAAARGDGQAVQALLKDGADPNATQADGTTALLYAAHRGDAAMVAALIKAGADVSAPNAYGASPLRQAATIGATPVIEQLLRAGADANETNPEGETPLMIVARTGDVAAARLLLDHGARVDAREQWGGQTALMWAAAQSQPEMVRLLIKAGADVNARGKVRDWQRKITAEPRPKDMNKGGFTPLLYAAREGCIECARHLVKAGADIETGDPDRVTPLLLSIINLHWDLAAELVRLGADVNRWDFYGRSPLYEAIDFNTFPSSGRNEVPPTEETSPLELARMLLERGANPDMQLKLRPPYRHAIFDRGSDNILSAGATPLLRAARASDNDAIRLLLAHGASVDLANAAGVTPLMATAGIGYGMRRSRGAFKTEEEGLESLDLLLAAGADINARTYDPRGLQGYVGPDNYFSNYMPADGQTAMHGAAKNGWNKIIRYLVAHGAEIDVADEHGTTPYDLAMGRYEPAFLDTPPEPRKETAALLQSLCKAQPGCRMEEGTAEAGF